MLRGSTAGLFWVSQLTSRAFCLAVYSNFEKAGSDKRFALIEDETGLGWELVDMVGCVFPVTASTIAISEA